jgi:uncharacterized membrane protein YdbT with pleckstrin-like domain
MSYIKKHLIAGETVVYTTRLHWVVLLGPLLLGVIFGAPALYLLVRSATTSGTTNDPSVPMAAVGAILLVVALVCVARGLLKRNATEMAVTDKRVVIKVGLAARRTIELLLSKVESIGVEESMMGRILGYGTVVLRGTGGTPEPFDTVDHPIEFRKQVEQQIEKWQERSR